MRTTAFIVIAAITFVIFFYGKRVFTNIQNKMVQKEQFELIIKKIDSIFLENSKIISTLAKEKDTIYVKIRENIRIMDTIYNEANTYKVPEEQDEIIKELKRLSR